MSKEERRVPELRFKGFFDDWEQREFQEFTKLSQGLQIAISKRFLVPGENRVFYITNEFLNPKSKKRYYIESPSKSVIAEKDHILMTRTGNTGKIVTNVEGAYHNNFFKIAYSDIETSKLFLFYLLSSFKVQKKILIRAGTSTIPDLNHSDFYKIQVVIPKIEEQIQIGNILKKIDDTIALHQRKATILNKIKKIYFGKLFPIDKKLLPKLRFKYYDELWELRKLDNLIEKSGSGGTPKSTNSEYYNGNIPFLSISDISNSNGYINSTEKHITETGLKNSAAWIVPKGAVCLAMYASVGKVAILNIEATTSQAFYNMVFDNDNLRDFIYHRLNKASELNEWVRFISTGTQSNLNAKKVKNFEITLPTNNDEISKISSTLNNLETNINLNKRKVKLLLKIKLAYLRKMFI